MNRLNNIKIIFFLSVVLCFLGIGCSEDSPESTDATPPSKVELIPHLGDVGDRKPNGEIDYSITDRNNGIDAVTTPNNIGFNWIKIQWDPEPLQIDGDIHHIDIYRYNEFDTTDIRLVEEIPYHPDSSRYIDKFINYNQEKVNKHWYYFIEPFDESGFSTCSDTVSYKIIEKPEIFAPQTNSSYSVTENINFNWQLNPYYTPRILIFDSTHNLKYAKDLIPGATSFTAPEDFDNTFSFIPGNSYIWRIDVNNINGGAESEERTIHIENAN